MLNDTLHRQLAASRLFHNIGLESLEPLLETCGRRELAAGQTLLEPGVPNDRLYLLLTGELRVYLDDRELPAHAVLGEGDCAGEMSLIDEQKASARVIASQNCELLAIPRDTLWELVDRSHGVARNLLAILAGRLRNDNLTLVTSRPSSLEFEQAGSIDALTGLHNRHWMHESFPRALQRCEQDAAPLCLVLADIDHFRQFNERHGHLAGDAVLRFVARTLAESLRPQDLMVRHGGEEFAVLLPNTPIDNGVNIAERLRTAVAAIRIKLPEGGDARENITLSCGLAPLLIGDTLDSLLALAEEALVAAKRGGRNRVVLSPARA